MRIENITAEQLLIEGRREARVVMAMPAIDLQQASRSATMMARRASSEGLILVIHDQSRDGYIATCNAAFRQTRSEFFGYVAQDAFAGRLWLKVALNQIEKQQKSLLAFNDGKWHGMLASFGLVRRSWAERQYSGDLFHPSYHSHYGDAELTLLAKAEDVLCYSPRSVMLEVDWDKDEKLVNGLDRRTFKTRARHGFDGKINLTGATESSLANPLHLAQKTFAHTS
jgi:hypothetical protein